MRYLLLFFLVLTSQFYALAIETFIGPGYRRDDFTFKIYEDDGTTLALKEEFENGSSAVEMLSINLIWDRVRWELEGDFGWLVEAKGDVSARANSTSLGFDINNFYGYEANGKTELGYDISLYSFNWFDLNLTPLFGVQYRHLATRVKGFKTDDIQAAVGSPAFASYQEPKLNHADFWGPLFEARLGLIFTDRFSMRLYYQYQFLYYRHVIEPDIRTNTMPEGGNMTVQLDEQLRVIQNDTARSQLGGFDVRVEVLHDILIGLQGYGARVYTRSAKSKNVIDTTNYPAGTTSQTINETNAEFEWTIYWTSLYFGYRF